MLIRSLRKEVGYLSASFRAAFTEKKQRLPSFVPLDKIQ
jgi:hypothetical protein